MIILTIIRKKIVSATLKEFKGERYFQEHKNQMYQKYHTRLM
ncbi:hypothetical protein [Evansella tamaricis]|nr:hypothetical protein [Evansella tamaricis]